MRPTIGGSSGHQPTTQKPPPITSVIIRHRHRHRGGTSGILALPGGHALDCRHRVVARFPIHGEAAPAVALVHVYGVAVGVLNRRAQRGRPVNRQTESGETSKVDGF